MPNLQCCKCGRNILDCIDNNAQYMNVIKLIISRMKKKFFLYKITPDICHNEISSSDDCDGVFKLNLFAPTPEIYKDIDFFKMLKNDKLHVLKDRMIEKRSKLFHVSVKPNGYKSINSSSLIITNNNCYKKKQIEKPLSLKMIIFALLIKVYITFIVIQRRVNNFFKKMA